MSETNHPVDVTLRVLMEQPMVGLFGTCDQSTFRQDKFIPELEKRGIPSFNPQLPPGTWTPEFTPIETDHIALDCVQTWPVLSESYGLLSMSETGHSIASSMATESPLPKVVIAMIEPTLDDAPHLQDPEMRKASLKMRTANRSYLERSSAPNLYVVDSLDQMLDVAITMHGLVKTMVNYGKSYGPAYKRFFEGRQASQAFAEAMSKGLLGNPAISAVRR